MAIASHSLVDDCLKDLQARILLKPFASIPDGPPVPFVLKAACLTISPLIHIYHKVASGYTVPRYHAFLYILSAPAYRTHSPHGPPFLSYFRTFCLKWILLCINMKSRIICSQSLFLGATHQGLRTPFQISFCNSLPSSIPVNTFLFSHILLMHSFLLPFILRLLYFIPFELFWSTASEMLTTLLSPTFLSNASSQFLTCQLKLFSFLLTQLSQLVRPHPPFFLGTYILVTSLLRCSSLFIVMIFLDLLSIS